MDGINGLLSQSQIKEEINRLLSRKDSFAAIYLDIDNLKESNSVYGYDKGDQIKG